MITITEDEKELLQSFVDDPNWLDVTDFDGTQKHYQFIRKERERDRIVPIPYTDIGSINEHINSGEWKYLGCVRCLGDIIFVRKEDNTRDTVI